MGLSIGKKRGLLVVRKYCNSFLVTSNGTALFCSGQSLDWHSEGSSPRKRPIQRLFIQRWPQHSDQEMREVRGAVVHLQPTHHAMLLQVLRNAILRDSQMFRELRLYGFSAPLRSAAPDQIGNGHAQRLASLYVVVGG